MGHRNIASLNTMKVPAARIENLVTTESKDEVLVYDQDRHHIHHLNHSAAAVWTLCDGQRTVSDLVQAAAIDEDAVRIALRKLEDANLLDGPLSTGMRGTQSRRSFMKKAAVAGAIAVPAIVSISAPAAAGIPSCNVGADCNVVDASLGVVGSAGKLQLIANACLCVGLNTCRASGDRCGSDNQCCSGSCEGKGNEKACA